MKQRINSIRHEGLLNAISQYDESLGLMGDYDPAFYTKEALTSRFDQSKFTKRSLHPYQTSASFALYLLMLEDDTSFQQLEACKNIPLFTDKAYREKTHISHA